MDVAIRPLVADDAVRSWDIGYTALRVAGQAYGWQMPEMTDEIRERGQLRVRHVLQTDPGGAFVAEADGELVGVGLATRRESLWFLALLTVDTKAQGQGIGRRLLEATMQTLGPAGAICASDDPKALRRYRHAGFDLVPCYEAKGALDRALIPAISDVVSASYDDRRDFVEEIARQQRGAPHGPDLDFFAKAGRPLYITDTARGRGYVIGMEAGPAVLGATTVEAARDLLWTVVADATADEIDFLWLRHDQQWALDVALEARLSLRPAGSFCARGPLGPMSPYIPNGGLG